MFLAAVAAVPWFREELKYPALFLLALCAAFLYFFVTARKGKKYYVRPIPGLDALTEAVQHWPAAGVPDSPFAWTYTTALRKAIDRQRRAKVGAQKEGEAARLALEATVDLNDEEIPDDRLRLIFTCCHPALKREVRVALTLRLVLGLSATEIAAAFLVSEATIAKRLVRAKQKIRLARIPFRVPEGSELGRRAKATMDRNEGNSRRSSSRQRRRANRRAFRRRFRR